MEQFSVMTQLALRLAGYFPGRKVSVLPYKLDIQNEGYDFFKCAEEFAEKYGGLKVETLQLGAVDLNPSNAVRYAIPEWIQDDYSIRVGDKLCPFGTWAGNVLMMTPAGLVYGGMDNHLEYLGSSGEAALDALCRNDQSKFKVLTELE
jgi:hypothetical protein